MTKAELIERVYACKHLPRNLTKKTVAQIVDAVFTEMGDYFIRDAGVAQPAARADIPRFRYVFEAPPPAPHGEEPADRRPDHHPPPGDDHVFAGPGAAVPAQPQRQRQRSCDSAPPARPRRCRLEPLARRATLEMLDPGLELADLHIHVGGAVAPHILWSIAHEQGFKLPVQTYWEFCDLVTAKPEKVRRWRTTSRSCTTGRRRFSRRRRPSSARSTRSSARSSAPAA